ncbi:universal stress protein [bacterium]|nr:universal stress protein [bacterium]
MSDKLDQFESAFRHTERHLYEGSDVEINSLLYVTDAQGKDGRQGMADAKAFLSPSRLGGKGNWSLMDGGGWTDIESVLRGVEEGNPDVVVVPRFLKEEFIHPTHSLGVVLDVLTQAQPRPVLALPQRGIALPQLERVMVATDHLADNEALVDWGAAMAAPEGMLLLVHVEDDLVFKRYKEAISRIPDLDSAETPVLILEQLLHEPRGFIKSAVASFARTRPGLTVQGVVESGHDTAVFKELAREKDVDLLVVSTKDDGQQAMHGTAYALAIEMPQLPVMLL